MDSIDSMDSMDVTNSMESNNPMVSIDARDSMDSMEAPPFHNMRPEHFLSWQALIKFKSSLNVACPPWRNNLKQKLKHNHQTSSLMKDGRVIRRKFSGILSMG